jgi:hypothetical protein
MNVRNVKAASQQSGQLQMAGLGHSLPECEHVAARAVRPHQTPSTDFQQIIRDVIPARQLFGAWNQLPISFRVFQTKYCCNAASRKLLI